MVPTDGVSTDVQAQHPDHIFCCHTGLLALNGLGLHEGVHVPVRLNVVLLLILAHLGQQVCNTTVFQQQAVGCIDVALV